MLGCGFRVAVTVAFAMFCIVFNQAKFDSLNPIVRFIGNALMVLLLFDVGLAWPNKSLNDLFSDRELGYVPQPYLYVTLPLCILAGTFFVGALLVGGKALLAKWRNSTHTKAAIETS